ncbi:hypothetical protein DPMN_152790 [Dreissena polymorpha]|uniref:Uncharacterized protein n=1 Tax=Dreissena polymorpha TaxID=45954 RepID=A0A9D4FK75_DREPO|nr:hypothetical protein DPMN_152790 [Dreissena polymorpha]
MLKRRLRLFHLPRQKVEHPGYKLIFKVKASTEGDIQKRKIVITNEGYTVYARATSSNSVTGE